jgi:cytidine deaminase
METTSEWAELLQAAIAAREYAYAPYSHYRVGAALLTAGGRIYTGCNVENVAFSPTICAERTAVCKAVSEGEREFRAIVIVAVNSPTPCGVCRQTLLEFAPTLTVITANPAGDYRLFNLSELLPYGFAQF